MANRDPENFVSFDDYMGLNDSAGQDAMAKLLASKAGTESDPEKIRQMAQMHNQMAGEAGYGGLGGAGTDPTGGAYANTQSAATSGLASYSDFIKGLDDPQARQAALQKSFGGRASALDSMVAGNAGAGELIDARQGLGQLSSYVSGKFDSADQNFNEGKNSRMYMDKWEAQNLANRQAAEIARENSVKSGEDFRQNSRAKAFYNQQGLVNKTPNATYTDWGKSNQAYDPNKRINETRDLSGKVIDPGPTEEAYTTNYINNQAKSNGKQWVVGSDGVGRWV